ncbi:MAG TPA: phosphate acetyl/butaryl transferase [Candidatus Olsenella pullicola]|nr:phosphate acetyl/butaryl transferase [Candidatus Olsenella pullicola]
MTLIEKLIEDAKAAPSRRVALPECEAVKTLLAARRVLDEGVGTPVLVSPREVIEATAAEAGVSLDGMEIVDTSDEAAADALAERYMAVGARLLSAKGTRRKIKMPMWYAMVMEELGDVDCTFCGHTNTTGDVLMAAQTIIGLKEGVDVPSIFALVETEGFAGPEGNVICFADCGLNPEPTASELASIAISAADNVAAIMGWEPRVGFLSYSTCGSGAGSSVDRVNEAIELVHERRPDIAADGEFQLDAAVDAAVASKKVSRESAVAGRANVLIFPDLNSANLAVKIVQRFAHGAAYGHTLSGFRCPVADSSRGATVDEIVGDIAMLVLSAR